MGSDCRAPGRQTQGIQNWQEEMGDTIVMGAVGRKVQGMRKSRAWTLGHKHLSLSSVGIGSGSGLESGAWGSFCSLPTCRHVVVALQHLILSPASTSPRDAGRTSFVGDGGGLGLSVPPAPHAWPDLHPGTHGALTERYSYLVS